MSRPATYTLRAEDLYSKFGFGDGDGLSDFLADNDLYMGWEWDPTIDVVRTYLAPLLPKDFELMEIGTAHNPIRAADIYDDVNRSGEVEGISVDVTVAQVLALRPA